MILKSICSLAKSLPGTFGGFMFLFMSFITMLVVLLVGASSAIHKQDENIRSATCIEEFATIECFDKRIKGFQLRKELQLQLEAHRKNG